MKRSRQGGLAAALLLASLRGAAPAAGATAGEAVAPAPGVVAVLGVAAAPSAAPARATLFRPSALALPGVGGAREPELLLAQRSIEREWGLAVEDSNYKVFEVPGWRSPGLALALSAALPGAGEIYVGERTGWAFAALEAAGWVAYSLFRRRGADRLDEAEAFAGAPGDSVSPWSFARYRAATGLPTQELEALYAVDRDAFYDVIGRDDRYLAGWSGSAGAARDEYWSTRQNGERELRRARQAGQLLWLNHVVSAFDALRAARIHNIPLERNLEIKVRASWRGGAPAVAVALERRFR